MTGQDSAISWEKEKLFLLQSKSTLLKLIFSIGFPLEYMINSICSLTQSQKHFVFTVYYGSTKYVIIRADKCFHEFNKNPTHDYASYFS